MRLKRDNRLSFRRRQWKQLIRELQIRGRGQRESGAFLLAPAAEPHRVQEIVYFDDIDPDCLTGAISISGVAYSKLWRRCERTDLRVVGDVHTHPGQGVDQSATDRANPMIAKRGHLAVIMPSFAVGQVKPKDVGVHEYLGDHEWRSWFGREAGDLIQVRWLR